MHFFFRQDKRNYPLYTGVRVKQVSEERSSTALKFRMSLSPLNSPSNLCDITSLMKRSPTVHLNSAYNDEEDGM